MVATANNFLPTLFSNFQGSLDNLGEARARIKILNNAQLIGLRINTAYIVLHPAAPFGINTISNTFTFSIL